MVDCTLYPSANSGQSAATTDPDPCSSPEIAELSQIPISFHNNRKFNPTLINYCIVTSVGGHGGRPTIFVRVIIMVRTH